MKRISTADHQNAAHLLTALHELSVGQRRQRLRGEGVIGDRVHRDRMGVLRRCLVELYAAGYRLQRIENLSTEHLTQIVDCWRGRGLSSGAIQTYASYLQVLCVWLKKPQLIHHLDALIERRRTAACSATPVHRADRCGRSVDQIVELACRVDARFACVLRLTVTYGCTPKEAWLLRPWQLIPTEETAELIAWARTFAAESHHSMIPPTDTLIQWKRKFYRFCCKIDLTRKGIGVTTRGLHTLSAQHLGGQRGGELYPVRKRD